MLPCEYSFKNIGLLTPKAAKLVFGLGFAQDPAGGAYELRRSSRPSRLGRCLPPDTLLPSTLSASRSRVGASVLGPHKKFWIRLCC